MRKTRNVIVLNKKNYKLENKAIFCGSFNPFHSGHLNVLTKALNDFSFIYVLVCQNENKPKHNLYKIANEINQILKQNNLENKALVLVNEGLTAQFIKQLDSRTIIRGFRNKKDLRFEKRLYKKYLEFNPNIFYKLYKSDEQYLNISSSKIRNSFD